MEDWNISILSNPEKMEKYLERLNNKDQKVVNETLYKIKNQLLKIDNYNLDDNYIHDIFLNQFSQKLMSNLLSSDKEEMLPILMFFINILVENLDKSKFIPFLRKITKILNKKELIHSRSEVTNIHLELIEAKLACKLIENSFYESLRVGSQVDYFYIQLNSDKGKEIGIWTRAEVIETYSSLKGKIKLLGLGLFFEINFGKPHIAPVNSFSHDYDWRNNLKKDDMIDVFIEETWNLSIITEIHDKSKLAKYKIVFYSGNDESLEQTALINVFSPLIKKPNQFSKSVFNQKGINEFPYDFKNFNLFETFNEYDGQKNVLPSNHFCYVKKNYLDLINIVASNKNLEKMKRILSMNLSLDEKKEYCILFLEIILPINKFLYHEVARSFYNDFLPLVRSIMNDLMKDENCDTERLIKIFNIYSKLLKRHYIIADYKRICITFYLDCIESFLLKDMRKNDELALIFELFETKVTNLEHNEILLDEMEKRNIKKLLLNTIFINNLDINLLQICSRFIKKLFCLGYFSDEIEDICSILLKKHNLMNYKKEIYRFLSEIAENDILVKFIISSIVDRINIEKNEILLINNLYHQLLIINFLHAKDGNNYEYIVNILISYYFDEKCDKETRNLLKTNFYKLEEFTQYLPLIFKAINSHPMPVKCLSKLRKLYSEIDTIELRKKMIEDFRYINIVINGYEKYHNDIQSKMKAKRLEQNDPHYNFIENEPFNKKEHDDIVKEIFYSLANFATLNKDNIFNSIYLEEVGFEIFFDLFVKNPICYSDVFKYANFLTESDNENFPFFYEKYNKILYELSMKKSDMDEFIVSFKEMEDIWNLFIKTNILEGKMRTISSKSKITNIFLFSKIYKDNELLNVLCESKDLSYIIFLWNHLIRIKESNNKKFLEEMLNQNSKFIQLFLFNNEELKNDVTNWEYFLNLIFITFIDINEKSNFKYKNLIINNLLNILHLFITKTEVIKLGVYSHSSLVTHSILTIPFSNHLTNRYHRTSLISNIKLRCASNCTIWDIKVQLGKIFGIIPEIITTDKASSEINIEENGKTIRESFINLEKINKVLKSKLFSKFPREPLVKNNECTPGFIKVLTEIFELYSTDNRLSIENFIEFIKTCVDEDLIKYNDKRIKMFLEKYDLDKDLLVSLESLLKFYLFNEKEKNGVIWSNLYNFNIKNDLKNLDVEYDNYKIDKTLFPRYSLSTKNEYFHYLYNFSSSDKENLNQISEILFMLTTNKSVFKRIMLLDPDLMIETDGNSLIINDKWDSYLFLDCPIKFHYNLNIIFSLFTIVLYDNEKVDIQRDQSYLISSEDDSYLLEISYLKKYIEVFFRTGGINLTIESFLRNWGNFNENCIMLVLNIIIFIFCLFNFSTSEKQDLVQNLKVNFSNLVKIYDYGQFKIINPVPSNFYEFKRFQENQDTIEDSNNIFWNDLTLKYKEKILENIDFTNLVRVLISMLVQINNKKEWRDKDRNIFNITLNLIYLISDMKFFKLQNYLFQNNNLFREILLLPSGFTNQTNYLIFKLNHLLNTLIENISNKSDLSCLSNITDYLSKEIFDENKQIISLEMAKTYIQILSIHINDENSQFDFMKVFDYLIKYLKNNRFNSKLKCYLDILKVIIPKIQHTENISDLIYVLDSIIFNCENLKFKVFDDEEIRKSILDLLVSVISLSNKNQLDIIFQTNFSKLPLKTKDLKKCSSNYKEKKVNNFVVVYGKRDFIFNSTVQSLFFLRSFKKIIFSVTNVDQERQKFLYHFQRMFCYLEFSQRRYFDIDNDSFFEIILPTLSTDSGNLLLSILQNLRIDLEFTEYRYLIDSYFSGKFVMKEECTICKTKSLFLDKFLNLQISINDQNTVKELYEYIESSYFSEKLLNKNCLACGGRISTQKYIYDLPNYLIVSFKDIRSEERKEVTINKKLDLKYDINYIYNSKEKYIKITNPDTFHEEELLIYEREDTYYQYELVSAIKYDKNDYDSSYVEISLNEIQNEINDCENLSLFGETKPSWIEFYDDSVNCLISKEIKTSWLEPLISGENVVIDNPVVLIYEKKKRNPIKMVETQKEILDDTNAVIKTMNKRNKNLLKKSLDIFNVDNINYISKKETFFDNLYLFNEKTNEITYYTFFENLKIEKENTGLNNIIEEINKDNLNFDIERMIFGKYFSKFLENFIYFSMNFCISNKELKEKNKLKKLFKLCIKLFYEIPMKNCEILRFNAMINNINSIVKEIPEYSKYIVTELYKRKTNIFDILIYNKDDQIQSASHMISRNLAENLDNNISNNKEITNKIFEMLDLILIKTIQTSKYQYLILLEQLIKTNSLPILTFFFKNRITTKLLSFFTFRKDKPLFKTSISLLSLIVSYCETETWKHKDLINHIVPSTFSGGIIQPFKLTEIENYYLYSEEFYTKIIKYRLFAEITILVKHLMFRNANFSKMFILLMHDKFNQFEVITKTSIERKDLVLLLASSFGIDDLYSKLRFQYFFGIPQLRSEDLFNPNPDNFYYTFVSPKDSDENYTPTINILKLTDKPYFIDIFENLYNNVISETCLFKYLCSIPSLSKISSNYLDNLFYYLIEEINSRKNYIKMEKESSNKVQSLYNSYVEEISKFCILDKLSIPNKVYSIYIKYLPKEELNKKGLHLFDVYYTIKHSNSQIAVTNEFEDVKENLIEYKNLNIMDLQTDISFSMIIPIFLENKNALVFKEINDCNKQDNLYQGIRSIIVFNNSNVTEKIEFKLKVNSEFGDTAENIDFTDLIATCKNEKYQTLITYNKSNLYVKWSEIDIEVLFLNEMFEEKIFIENEKKLQIIQEHDDILIKGIYIFYEECPSCNAINILVNEKLKSYKCWICRVDVFRKNDDWKKSIDFNF